MPTDHDNRANLAPQFPLKMLLVEDNAVDAELCLEFLSVAQFDLTADVVQTRQEFTARLQAETYDIVIADYNLGSWTGMDAFDILREEAVDTPFILLTAALGDQTAVECLKRGLADYVLKDRMERLPVAIYRVLEEKAALTERRRADRIMEDADVKFRALAECSRAAVFIEQGGQCSYVNRAAEIVTGFAQRELLAKGFWELIPESSRPSVYIHQILRPWSGDAPVRCQMPILTKSGDERWLDCTAKMIQNEGRLSVLIAAVPIPAPTQHRSRSEEPVHSELAENNSAGRPRRTLAFAATPA